MESPIPSLNWDHHRSKNNNIFLNEIGRSKNKKNKSFVEVGYDAHTAIHLYSIYAYTIEKGRLESIHELTPSNQQEVEDDFRLAWTNVPSSRAYALVLNTTQQAIDFWSIGAKTRAAEGPAQGMLSLDIATKLQEEDMDEFTGRAYRCQSYSLTGNGCNPSDFQVQETACTPGSFNTGQSITSCQTTAAPDSTLSMNPTKKPSVGPTGSSSPSPIPSLLPTKTHHPSFSTVPTLNPSRRSLPPNSPSDDLLPIGSIIAFTVPWVVMSFIIIIYFCSQCFFEKQNQFRDEPSSNNSEDLERQQPDDTACIPPNVKRIRFANDDDDEINEMKIWAMKHKSDVIFGTNLSTDVEESLPSLLHDEDDTANDAFLKYPREEQASNYSSTPTSNSNGALSFLTAVDEIESFDASTTCSNGTNADDVSFLTSIEAAIMDLSSIFNEENDDDVILGHQTKEQERNDLSNSVEAHSFITAADEFVIGSLAASKNRSSCNDDFDDLAFLTPIESAIKNLSTFLNEEENDKDNEFVNRLEEFILSDFESPIRSVAKHQSTADLSFLSTKMDLSGIQKDENEDGDDAFLKHLEVSLSSDIDLDTESLEIYNNKKDEKGYVIYEATEILEKKHKDQTVLKEDNNEEDEIGYNYCIATETLQKQQDPSLTSGISGNDPCMAKEAHICKATNVGKL